jgi:predicted dehydrogenase
LETNAKAKKNKQCVVIGHHLRFEKKHWEPIQMLHDGAIGELRYIRIFFNQGAIWYRRREANMTEMQFQVNNWYHFNWLSGDHIVEQHVHDIDVMNWFTGDKHPTEANGMGGRTVRPKNLAEIFDYHTVEYTFDNGVRGYSASRQIPGCWDSFSEHAYGTKGHLDIDVMNWFMGDKHPIEANGMGGRAVGPENSGEIFDYHAVEYTFDNGVRGFSRCRQVAGCWDSFSEHAYGTKGHIDIEGHGTARMFVQGKEPQVWRRDTSGHQVEMDYLFGAVARGEEFNNGDLAAEATLTAILGRMATYSGKVVKWDDAMNSQLDTFPKQLTWDADPGPKPDANGNYPRAQPGFTVAW